MRSTCYVFTLFVVYITGCSSNGNAADCGCAPGPSRRKVESNEATQLESSSWSQVKYKSDGMGAIDMHERHLKGTRLDLTDSCTYCAAVYPQCQGQSAYPQPKSVELRDSDNSTDPSTPKAKAYGYGFLILMAISLLSLLVVVIVPFLQKDSRCGSLYKYLYALLISLGVSALFCDAVLHLIPHALNFHSHDHSHSLEQHSTSAEDREVVWRGCAVVAGMVATFIFESILHSLYAQKGHGHSHSLNHTHSRSTTPSPVHHPATDHTHPTEVTSLLGERFQQSVERCSTVPHGCNRCDTVDGGPVAILHPKPLSLSRSCTCYNKTQSPSGGPIDTSFSQADQEGVASSIPVRGEEHQGINDDSLSNKHCCSRHFSSIKPLALVIVSGDALHNLADGIALGAAISQNLGVGISTAIAILCHEVPHELGDYVILLSTGMHWCMALGFNCLSTVAAIVGFFVGVSIGTESEQANDWILAVTAGQFLYIALVDLLPELVHSKEKGFTRWLQFLLALVGFGIGFAVMLLIAIFEDKFDALFK